MKKISLFCILLAYPFFCSLLAQSTDSISVRQIVENGSKGDIILGKEYQKKQLAFDPQLTKIKSPCKKQNAMCSKKKKPKPE